MLNLDSGSSGKLVGGSIKFDHRASSLHRALDINNMPSLTKVKSSHKSSVSFHNFRFIPLVSQINSTVQSPRQHIPRQTSPTLNVITSSLPKASTQFQHRSSLASTISPKMSKAYPGGDADMFFYNVIRQPMKPTLSNQALKPAAPTHNRSISGSQTKIISPDMSMINQSITKLDHTTSGNMSLKKISIIEEKLPLKRRGLNQDLRDGFRNIINSKEHGIFKDVIPKLTVNDKDQNSKSPPRPQKKTEYMFEKNSQMERLEAEREDALAVDEINKKAVHDFQRKINLYNLTKGSYIVNPDEKSNSARNVGKVRRLGNSTKPAGPSKPFFQAILPKRSSIPPFVGLSPPKYYYYIEPPKAQTTKNAYSQQYAPALKPQSMNMSQSKVEEEEGGSLDDVDGEERQEDKKKAIGTVRSDDMAAISPLFKMKNDPEDKNAAEFDIQKIKSLADLIPKKRLLNKDEETFFKLIKDGDEDEVISILGMQPEIVRILDNRNETPLHWAVKRGHFNMVVQMCKAGADIFALDMAGRNAMDIAARLGTMEILEYLTLHKKKKNEECLFKE